MRPDIVTVSESSKPESNTQVYTQHHACEVWNDSTMAINIILEVRSFVLWYKMRMVFSGET